MDTITEHLVKTKILASTGITRIRVLDDVIILLVTPQCDIKKTIQSIDNSSDKKLLVLTSSMTKAQLERIPHQTSEELSTKIITIQIFASNEGQCADIPLEQFEPSDEETVNNIVSDLLLAHCPKSRPLNLYRANFFLPLLPFDYDHDKLVPLPEPSANRSFNYNDYCQSPCYQQPGYEQSCQWLKEQNQNDTQAYYFFSQSIRNQLFDIQQSNKINATQALKEWRADPQISKPLTLTIASNHQNTQIKARVSTLRLYRYFNDVSILSFVVEPHLDDKIECRNDESWWHQLIFSSDKEFESIRSMQVERWLSFTRLARVLYPSFQEQTIEGKIAELILSIDDREIKAFGDSLIQSEGIVFSSAANNSQPFNNILKELLLQFYTEDKHKDVNNWLEKHFGLDDDRMFCSTSYALGGPEPSGSFLTPKHNETKVNYRARQLYHLALHVDRYDDIWSDFEGLNYNPEFLSEFAEKSTYRVWEQKGLLYGFTDHSCTWVGHDGFFRDIIATKHIPHLYEKMLVQGLFYRNSLRWYSHRISANTNHLKEGFTEQNTNNIEDLRMDFLRFTNLYWFNEHTDQMQGKALSRLLHQALELDREYEFIKEEIERIDEFCRFKNQHVISRGGIMLAVIASFVALITLILDSFSIALIWTDAKIADLSIAGWGLTALPTVIFLLVLARVGLGFFINVDEKDERKFTPFFNAVKKWGHHPFIGFNLCVAVGKKLTHKLTRIFK